MTAALNCRATDRVDERALAAEAIEIRIPFEPPPGELRELPQRKREVRQRLRDVPPACVNGGRIIPCRGIVGAHGNTAIHLLDRELTPPLGSIVFTRGVVD